MPDSHPPEAGLASLFGEADKIGLTSSCFHFHYSKLNLDVKRPRKSFTKPQDVYFLGFFFYIL